MPDRPIVLVVPERALDPMTGTGQRSHVLHAALSSVAPVVPVVIGPSGGIAALDALPGAPGHRLRTRRPLAGGPLRLALGPSPERAVGADLRALLERHRAGLAVFRYADSFAVTGAGGWRARPCPFLVDVDDFAPQEAAARLRGALAGWPGRARLAALAERGAVARHRRLLSRADALLFTTAEDRDAAAMRVPVRVIPNVPFVTPAAPAPASAGDGLLFVGTAAHGPNVEGLRWFVRQVLPRVRAGRGSAVLSVVGSGDWAGLPDIAGPGVRIVGRVPSVGAAYRGCRAVVLPVFAGGGSKIKLVEACAFARPVVSTTHGLRGFGAALAGTATAADTPGRFAEACLRFLADPDAADRAGERARAAQRHLYSRESVETATAAFVQDLLAGRG